MRQLRGKLALVTGAASGIGRALALRLAGKGVRLYLLDIDRSGLANVVAESKSLGVEAVGRTCDLSQRAQVSDAVKLALDRWDGIDLLVNNAGITYYGRTAQMSDEHWDQVMAINLAAPVQFIREFLPSLLARDEAHVLNVASICGLVGLGRVAAYSTAKFALVGLSESLRAEYSRQGLGVTALCPGLVDTKLFEAAPHGRDRTDGKRPPRWLLCTADQVAARGLRAIQRNHGVVVMQPYARALHGLKRWMPGVLDLSHRIRRRRQQPPSPPPAEERKAA